MAAGSSPAVWCQMDDYIADRLLGPDAVLDAVLEASREAGLPDIAVSPAHGRLLTLFARMVGARRILEVGTLGGYSAICMARALPDDGRLVTLEFDLRHALVARANIAKAGLADKVEIRPGLAIETLPKLEDEGAGPFDMIFIDADKPSNPDYLAWALKLSRPGTLIIVDNVVRDGRVLDAASKDPNVKGVRALFDQVAQDPRLAATALQTVGVKGYDGFALMLVGEGA